MNVLSYISRDRGDVDLISSYGVLNRTWQNCPCGLTGLNPKTSILV